jgi:alpha-L-fucosidase
MDINEKAKNMKLIWSCLALTFSLSALSRAEPAPPTFEKIYERKIPAWFNEAKFGIFVVWGPYSVPSFRVNGYAEWYWQHALPNSMNQHRKNPVSAAFHERVYGKDFEYEQFAGLFKAELWDPKFWCDLFADAGAKYVVTTANYHDGFAMWPTDYAKTGKTTQWNSLVTGPRRDIIGELNEAGTKRGLKMGIYYSLYEWNHPLWLENQDRFASEWLAPKFKEVVSKYQPWAIFLDGDWAMDYKRWRTNELAHWLYTDSPVKDTVVVNDRWGGGTRGQWGDVFESEYGGGKYTTPDHPWQEDRGIGKSYGYNRSESIYDYDSRETLIRTFSNVVGGGGNFLLCVGPSADGCIPVIMQERLLQIGEWLKVNGEAIYGSTASPFWPRQFDWGTVSSKPGKLYLHVQRPELGSLEIKGINARITKAQLLHKTGRIDVAIKSQQETLRLEWPSHLNDSAATIIALDLAGDCTMDKTPRQYDNGIIEFNCRAMKLHGNTFYPQYIGYENQLYMRNWKNPNDYLSANFIVEKPGKYEVTLLYAALQKQAVAKEGEQTGAGVRKGTSTVGGKFTLQLGDHVKELSIQNVGSDQSPQPVIAGTVEFTKAGIHPFAIKPINDENWSGFFFQGVKLVPVK